MHYNMHNVYWYVSLSAIPWVHLPTHGIARRLIRQSKGAGIFSESIPLLAEAKKNTSSGHRRLVLHHMLFRNSASRHCVLVQTLAATDVIITDH